MSLVAPTLKNRIESLDVLRGVAILGILLANIFSFGWPTAGEMSGLESPITGMNQLVEGMRVFLVSGKMRGLFCLLFGAGMFLQFSKLSAVGRWPGGYLRRNSILMGIGLLHMLLVWHGDILFMYSLTAFIVMWLVRLDDKVILWISAALISLTMLCGLGSVAAMSLMPDMGGAGAGFMAFLSPENEMRTFASGSYLDQVLFRAKMFPLVLSSFLVIFMELGSLFLIGFWMAKVGIFAKPSAHRRERTALVWVGSIGLLLNFALGVAIAITGRDELKFLAEMGLNGPMSIGIAVFGAIMVERLPGGIISRILAPVGKMALTSYLTQSVVCVVFFYSWGLGNFGKLNYFLLLGFVFVVWAVNLAFAHLWLKRFKMGPVEWCWRSLSLGRNAISASPAVGAGSLPPRLQ